MPARRWSVRLWRIALLAAAGAALAPCVALGSFPGRDRVIAYTAEGSIWAVDPRPETSVGSRAAPRRPSHRRETCLRSSAARPGVSRSTSQMRMARTRGLSSQAANRPSLRAAGRSSSACRRPVRHGRHAGLTGATDHQPPRRSGASVELERIDRVRADRELARTNNVSAARPRTAGGSTATQARRAGMPEPSCEPSIHWVPERARHHQPREPSRTPDTHPARRYGPVARLAPRWQNGCGVALPRAAARRTRSRTRTTATALRPGLLADRMGTGRSRTSCESCRCAQQLPVVPGDSR